MKRQSLHHRYPKTPHGATTAPGVAAFIARGILILTLPVAVLASIYIWIDPFKVLTRYDSDIVGNMIGDSLKLSVNKGMLSVQALERRIESGDIPDSFIFGASISCYYETDYWRGLVETGTMPMHFDSSSEGARSLRYKLEYLKSRKIDIRNALIVIDPLTIEGDITGGNIMSADPPGTAGWWTWPVWHARFFKAFYDPDFLASYIPSQLAGTRCRYGLHEIFDHQPSVYDMYRNEESIPEWDEDIRQSPDAFYAQRTFPGSRVPHCDNPCRIDRVREREYRRVAQLLEGSDYHVVASPTLRCDTLSRRDACLLAEIFGTGRFHDFTARMSYVAMQDSNWYDTRHYRAPVARAIMDAVYRGAENTVVCPVCPMARQER